MSQATDLSPQEIRASLIDELGEENAWFIDLLLAVSDWNAKGIPVTDLVIRENNLMFYSSVKAFLPIVKYGFNGNEYNLLKPTREMLKNLVRNFVDSEEYVNSTLSALSGEYTSIDTALAVLGLGIYRFNISYSEDLFNDGGYSMSLSVRVLDFTIPSFEKLSYPEKYQSFIKRLVAKSKMKDINGNIVDASTVRTGGLILHVGATGSGKTTSIAAEIGYLAKETAGKIITYENPIEYRFIGTKAQVQQLELGMHIKPDDKEDITDKILKHLLRNNPSIALYGEARTRKEMKAVLDIASRGHLIFSTIHANNVKEALSTLLSVAEDEPYLLANGLLAIVAHKLILNEKGQIVPVYEFYVPDKVDKTSIAEKDLQSVYRRFYTEKANPYGFTFKDHLSELANNGIITEEIKRSTIATAPLVFDPMGQQQ